MVVRSLRRSCVISRRRLNRHMPKVVKTWCHNEYLVFVPYVSERVRAESAAHLRVDQLNRMATQASSDLTETQSYWLSRKPTEGQMRCKERALALILALLLVAVACSGESPTEPLNRSELTDLRLEAHPTGVTGDYVLDVEAILSMQGGLVKGALPLNVTVTTSAGDQETVQLDRKICQTEEGNEFVCNEFIVGVERGVANIRNLLPHVEEDLDGRLKLLTACDTDGNCEVVSDATAVVVLFSGDLEEAMEIARSWPNVTAVDLNGIVRTDDLVPTDDPSTGTELETRLPLDVFAPAAGNDIVEADHGDGITVSYRPAGGEELTAALTFR